MFTISFLVPVGQLDPNPQPCDDGVSVLPLSYHHWPILKIFFKKFEGLNTLAYSAKA